MRRQGIVSRGTWRHGDPPLDAAGRSVPGQVVAHSGCHQGDDPVEWHAPDMATASVSVKSVAVHGLSSGLMINRTA